MFCILCVDTYFAYAIVVLDEMKFKQWNNQFILDLKGKLGKSEIMEILNLKKKILEKNIH